MAKWAALIAMGLIVESCGGSGSETPPPIEPTGGAQNLQPGSARRLAKPSAEGEDSKKDPIEAEEEERVKRQKSGAGPQSDPPSR